jgi:hypothetical protein
MKTSDVLFKAGDVLRERGWCQGYYERGGKHCAVGAMRASGQIDTYDASALFGFVATGAGVAAALQFNDALGRTAADVMFAMDAAYVLQLQVEGVEPGDVL